MFGIAILIALAVIFYRIGENDYSKGWPPATVSVVLSYIGASFFGLLGMLGANVLLFLGMLVYNMASKKPPGSQSGF